ncbi:arrestin [Glonium stellatum]|uniref:Arrestin n=1 Tax=Glonium stellatum TaxID=574774 RepID=A0A8E2JMC4_9PEZI|nr:arrestin [Glonium stellatum]
MLVQIVLDKPHTHFTNLDVISGKVLLRVPSTSNISGIVVKLEGESRTRLIAPSRPDRQDRQRPVLEVHKLLYKTQLVFPPYQLQDDGWNQRSYTLNVGSYEYPFQFKLPFNNACSPANSLATNLNFTGLAMEVAKSPTHHVRQTLPPSLSGFPGEAEIRYYVKVTVNRPQFFKENPRAWANFTFLPIESPRPPRADGETYARRQHQFLENAPGDVGGSRKKSFFDSMRKNSQAPTPVEPPTSDPPPRFALDARLPNPAIITCNKDIPLRILMKTMSERSKQIYLQMLQIELIGYTKVRAHEIQRTESNSWIIASISNMAIPLGNPADPVGTEVPVNQEYWSGKPLPNTVAPTFETCNISRFYELEVRVGLGYGSYEHGKDQLVVLPLRLPVKVYSGIAPPAALLQAMASGSGMANPDLASAGEKLKPEPSVAMPHTPVDPPAFTANQSPPQQGAHLPPQNAPGYDEAPPSYEDAIGQDLPPIDGYRGEYAPPPFPEGEPTFAGDEKRR